MTHQMVIIDYAIDRGMSRTQAVALLSSFAVADLFGRLASGLVADKRLVRKRNIVSICILLIGVLIFMTPAAKTFRILLIMTIALGFVSGAIIVLFSVLTMEYVGLDRLPIALGTSAFVVGSSTLVRPLVIGYFRDTFGSYDGLFRFVGIIALLAAILWLSEPFARLWVARKRKYGFGHKVIIV
jgi:MCP family monocarboxylic acid transporter-like MFS transporter 12